ncbi:class I adenylate-forming enzyme family protein [Halorarum halobium]|uniref:class I adenylate-forming enzyme family protein n=1 Tax=Halorarum halobium TaxID=3075121 RepID=UPI0028A6B180|nr:AMP-binding protein [Halobaculum sp. XH14]
MDRQRFPADARSGNVARLYDETADARGDALALETPEVRFTHAALRDRAARLAGGFRDVGFEPDDRLAIVLHNRAEAVLAALASFRAGTPFVPMNPQFTPDEIAGQLDDGEVAGVVTEPALLGNVADAIEAVEVDPTVVLVADDGAEGAGEGKAEAVGDDGADDGGDGEAERAGDGRESEDAAPGGLDTVAFGSLDGSPHLAERDDGDVAMQPYTSGTTGEPKGVQLTHRNLRAQSLMGFERTALSADEERFLSVLPLAHIAGFVNRTWQPLVRGGAVFLRDPDDWDPEAAMATIEAERITKFGAVTTMYVDVVGHERFGEYDLSSLREAMEGGDRMSTAVQERFEAEAGLDLFEAYGLTETGGGTHVGFGSTFGPRPGTIGQPLRATDCKVVDDAGREVAAGETGELLVRGPHVTPGYHERPEETAAAFTDDGYFRTGDLARRDEDNYYEIVGRKDDVIVTAGYTVYPGEVEDVLERHDGVVDAAVVGAPDERRTATVEAYVVTDDGAAVSETALKEHCLEHLAPYKHPRSVAFVDRLPRTYNGKVRRVQLRERTASD